MRISKPRVFFPFVVWVLLAANACCQASLPPIYLSQNEVRQYYLNDYFVGNNLTFAINTTQPGVTLTQKVNRTSSLEFASNLSIQTSHYLQNGTQEPFLAILNSNNTLLVYNIGSDTNMTLDLEANSSITCFDFAFVSSAQVFIVDCLFEEGATRENIFYFINSTGGVTTHTNIGPEADVNTTAHRHIQLFNYTTAAGANISCLIRYQRNPKNESLVPSEMLDFFDMSDISNYSLIAQFNVSSLKVSGFQLQDVQVGAADVFIVGKSGIYSLPFQNIGTNNTERVSDLEQISLSFASYEESTDSLNVFGMSNSQPLMLVIQNNLVVKQTVLNATMNFSLCTAKKSQYYIALVCETLLPASYAVENKANASLRMDEPDPEPDLGNQVNYSLIVIDLNYPQQIFYSYNFPNETASLAGFDSSGRKLYLVLPTRYIAYDFNDAVVALKSIQNSGSLQLQVSGGVPIYISYVVMQNSLSDLAVGNNLSYNTFSNFERVSIDGIFYGAGVQVNGTAVAMPNMSVVLPNLILGNTGPLFQNKIVAKVSLDMNTSLRSYRVLAYDTNFNWSEYRCGLTYNSGAPATSSIQCSLSNNSLVLPENTISINSSCKSYDVVLSSTDSQQSFNFLVNYKPVFRYQPDSSCNSVFNQDPALYANPFWFCVQNSQIVAFSLANFLSGNASASVINLTSLNLPQGTCQFLSVVSNPTLNGMLFVKCSMLVLLVDITELSLNNTILISQITVNSSIFITYNLIASRSHLVIISTAQNIIQEWNIDRLTSSYLRREYYLYNYTLSDNFAYSELSNLLYMNATQENGKPTLLVFRPGYSGNSLLQYIIDLSAFPGYRLLDVSSVGGVNGYEGDLVNLVSSDGVMQNMIIYPKFYVMFQNYYQKASSKDYFKSLYDNSAKATLKATSTTGTTSSSYVNLNLMKNIQILVTYNGINQVSLPTNITYLSSPARFFFQGTIIDLDFKLDSTPSSLPYTSTPPVSQTANMSFSSMLISNSLPVDMALINRPGKESLYILYSNNIILEYDTCYGTTFQKDNSMNLPVVGSCSSLIVDPSQRFGVFNCSHSAGFSVVIANMSNINQTVIVSNTSIVKFAFDPKGIYLALLLGSNSDDILLELFNVSSIFSDQHPLLRIPVYSAQAIFNYPTFSIVDFFLDWDPQSGNLLNLFLLERYQGPIICQINSNPYPPSYQFLANAFPLTRLLLNDYFVLGRFYFTALHYIYSTVSSYQLILVSENFHSYALTYSIGQGKVGLASVSLCFLRMNGQQVIKSVANSTFFITFAINPAGEIRAFGYSTVPESSDISGKYNQGVEYNYKTTEYSVLVANNSAVLSYMMTDEQIFSKKNVNLPIQATGNGTVARFYLLNPYQKMIQSFNFKHNITLNWSEAIFDYNNLTIIASNQAYVANYTFVISSDFFHAHLALIWTIGVTVLLVIAVGIFIWKCLMAKKKKNPNEQDPASLDELYVDDFFL